MPSQTGYFDTLKSAAGKVFTYLASITVTGTDGKTITCTQDTSLDEAVAMSSKATQSSGSWTPGITFGGGNTGVTYAASNSGFYTKTGNLVTVTGYLELTSKGSSTGDAVITGLPFTCAETAAATAVPSLLMVAVTFAGQYGGYIGTGQALFNLVQISTLGAYVTLTDANFANNSTVMISMTYRWQ